MEANNLSYGAKQRSSTSFSQPHIFGLIAKYTASVWKQALLAECLQGEGEVIEIS